ncbi:hypothetical protein [uncultured Litoreibacter sp.]|uniref:hypothetical protein n=1 Tax=uncultured Litoreibacter sp. TaxID=1392394 RepID=UPI00261C1B44|nr:hypothetical protein [uncultured Litoreibacter sp.]
MQFNFMYSSFSDFFSSFTSPRAEVRPGLNHTNLRVQKRGTAANPEYMLRFSSWGNILYVRLDEHEFDRLEAAFDEIKRA